MLVDAGVLLKISVAANNTERVAGSEIEILLYWVRSPVKYSASSEESICCKCLLCENGF